MHICPPCEKLPTAHSWRRKVEIGIFPHDSWALPPVQKNRLQCFPAELGDNLPDCCGTGEVHFLDDGLEIRCFVMEAASSGRWARRFKTPGGGQLAGGSDDAG